MLLELIDIIEDFGLSLLPTGTIHGIISNVTSGEKRMTERLRFLIGMNDS